MREKTAVASVRISEPYSFHHKAPLNEKGARHAVPPTVRFRVYSFT